MGYGRGLLSFAFHRGGGGTAADEGAEDAKGSGAASAEGSEAAPAGALASAAAATAAGDPDGEALRSLRDALHRLDGLGLTAFFRMDTDSSGNLSLAEFRTGTDSFLEPLSEKEARYALRGFDADRDGSVGAREFIGEQALGHFGRSTAEIDQALSTLAELKMKIPSPSSSRLDANNESSFGDDDSKEPKESPGTLAFVEFRRRLKKRSLPKAFAAADADGDGRLSVDELKGGDSGLGEGCCKPALSMAEASHVLRGLDADRDGKISLLELECASLFGHFFQGERALEAAKALFATSTTTTTTRRPSHDDGRSKSDGVEAGENTTTTTTISSSSTSSSSSSSSRTTTSSSTATSTSTTTTTGPPITPSEFARRATASFGSPLRMLHKMQPKRGDPVNASSFASAATELEPPLSSKASALLFRGLDADGDGVVADWEFLGALFLGRLSAPPATLRSVGASDAAADAEGAAGAEARSGESAASKTTPPLTTTTPPPPPRWGDEPFPKAPEDEAAKDDFTTMPWKRPAAKEALDASHTGSAALDGVAFETSAPPSSQLPRWSDAASRPEAHAADRFAPPEAHLPGAPAFAGPWVGPGDGGWSERHQEDRHGWSGAALMRRIGYNPLPEDTEAARLSAKRDAENLVEGWDLDYDGAVDVGELLEGGHGAVPALTHLEAQSAMLSMDADRDHRLNVDEVARAFVDDLVFRPDASPVRREGRAVAFAA